MEITDAISKVDNDSETKGKIEGKYLCSALSFLEGWDVLSWELNYYDKESNKIVQVTVAEPGVSVKGEGEPFKDKGIDEVDMSRLKITATKALEIAHAHYDEKYKPYQIQRVFLSLHGGENQYWSVSVITKHLVIVMITIDTESGEIKESKAHTLFDKERTAY